MQMYTTFNKTSVHACSSGRVPHIAVLALPIPLWPHPVTMLLVSAITNSGRVFTLPPSAYSDSVMRKFCEQASSTSDAHRHMIVPVPFSDKAISLLAHPHFTYNDVLRYGVMLIVEFVEVRTAHEHSHVPAASRLAYLQHFPALYTKIAIIAMSPLST